MPEKTITVAEYAGMQKAYEEAYADGTLLETCEVCGLAGQARYMEDGNSGIVWHPHCRLGALQLFYAKDWLKLAWDDYMMQILDRMWTGPRWEYFERPWSPYAHGKVSLPVPGSACTQSWRALMDKNRREHPGDSFFDRPLDPPEWEDYMDLAQHCMGIPEMHLGFAVT